jgi:hypothetical protein
MIEPCYLSVLRELSRRLDGSGVLWVVTGSLGFALQGMSVAIHDVDIQTDAVGAYEIERRFAAEVARPVAFSQAERIRSHFGALRLHGIDVELMGDIEKRLPDGSWDGPVDVMRHRRWASVTGMQIPVLDLAYEAEAYARLGRTEKAELLRRWLEQASPG